MIRQAKTRYGFGLALLCVLAVAWPDTVLLRDGKSLSGRISGETAESVTIDTSAGRFTFPRAQILQVTKEAASSNHRRDMEQFLKAGKIDAAMLVYHNSGLDETVPDAELANMFLQQLKHTAAGAVATSATTTELISKFTQPAGVPPEIRILVATFSAEHEDFATAQTLLRLAEQQAPTQFNWPADSLLPLLERIASAAVKASKGTLLAASAELAARLPAQADRPKQNQLAVYGKIDEQLRRGDFLSAIALFHPDYFLHRADLFVPLAERLVTAILAGKSPNTIVPALESSTATILPYINPELRLQAYKALVATQYETVGQEEAQATADQVSLSDADTGAVLEHLVEFLRRRSVLPDNSPVASYKLASWAKSMGLLEEAEGIFLTLRSDPRFTETVNLQLQIIDHQQAAKAIRQLRSTYDRGDINQLKMEAAAFLQTSPPDEFAQEARNLLQLADFEQWSHKRTSHGKAEAEFQQAERLANRGEYDEALSHLNQIQMDRNDSAAAQKADALRDRIMREKLRQATQTREKGTTPPSSTP